eukprot:767243-Hanusia_phi.AAC.4
MFRSDRENSSEVEVVKMYDVPEIDGGIFDDIDFANAGESDQAESSSFALTDELPEKLRRDSQDTNFSKIAPRRSRGISDAFEAPDAFSFDESPHERSSRASGVSRFTSFGGLENDSVSRSLEFESQTLGFGENALREEPQSMTQYSQMPMSQRMSEQCLNFAQKISSHLPDEDSQLSFGSILKGRPSKRTASRCFYFLLTLMNENVVRLQQPAPYEEIQILPTANTAMYSA